MPQVQFVDSMRTNPDPQGVQKFFSNLGNYAKEKQENAEISQILGNYRQNREDSNALEDVFLDLQSSTVGPSRRMEVMKSLQAGREAVSQRDKNLIEATKALTPPQPKKTQSSQPIDPEQLASIQAVRGNPEYQEASPSRKYQMLTDAGVSRENAEAESKIYAEEKKLQPGGEFGKLREKAVAEYLNKSFESGSTAEETRVAIEEARQASQGDISGPGIEAFAKNNPFFRLNIGLTPDEASLKAATKKLLEGTKGLFGPRPTEREIFILLDDMLPAIGKTKEANAAGLDIIEKFNNMKLLHADIVDELTEGGTKYVPNLEREAQLRMKPYVDQFIQETRAKRDQLNSQKEQESSKENTSKTARYKAPDGTVWEMTPEQVEAAAKKQVIFEPV